MGRSGLPNGALSAIFLHCLTSSNQLAQLVICHPSIEDLGLFDRQWKRDNLFLTPAQEFRQLEDEASETNLGERQKNLLASTFILKGSIPFSSIQAYYKGTSTFSQRKENAWWNKLPQGRQYKGTASSLWRFLLENVLLLMDQDTGEETIPVTNMDVITPEAEQLMEKIFDGKFSGSPVSITEAVIGLRIKYYLTINPTQHQNDLCRSIGIPRQLVS